MFLRTRSLRHLQLGTRSFCLKQLKANSSSSKIFFRRHQYRLFSSGGKRDGENGFYDDMGRWHPLPGLSSSSVFPADGEDPMNRPLRNEWENPPARRSTHRDEEDNRRDNHPKKPQFVELAFIKWKFFRRAVFMLLCAYSIESAYEGYKIEKWEQSNSGDENDFRVWTVGDYAFLDIMDEDSAMLEARVVQVLWCDKETGQETQVEQGVEIAKGVLSERDAAMQPQGSFVYVVQIEGTNKRVRKSGKQLFFQDELSLRLLFSPEHRAIGHFLRSVTGDYLALAIRPFLIAYFLMGFFKYKALKEAHASRMERAERVVDCLVRGVFSVAHLSSSKWEVRELTEVERSLDQQMRALGKTSLTVEASSQDETAFQLAPTDGGWAYILQGVPAFGVQFPPSIIRSVGQSKSAVLAERSGDIQDADLDAHFFHKSLFFGASTAVEAVIARGATGRIFKVSRGGRSVQVDERLSFVQQLMELTNDAIPSNEQTQPKAETARRHPSRQGKNRLEHNFEPSSNLVFGSNDVIEATTEQTPQALQQKAVELKYMLEKKENEVRLLEEKLKTFEDALVDTSDSQVRHGIAKRILVTKMDLLKSKLKERSIVFEMDCLKRTLERKSMVSTKAEMNRKAGEGFESDGGSGPKDYN